MQNNEISKRVYEFENSSNTYDKHIISIAKNIEVAGLPYTGSGVFIRDDIRLTKNEWWDKISDTKKYKRINQAVAAMMEMERIGIQELITLAAEKYISEK